MKKFLSVLLIVSLMLVAVGCGTSTEKEGSSSAEPKEKVADSKEVAQLSLQVNYTTTMAVYPVYEEVIQAFNKSHDDIQVELLPAPADYEAVMKTKMSVNDLPDLFATHGWSVARYSEFLLPLTNEPWAKDLNPAIEPVITDSNGDIFVLPLDVDVAGMAYNKDVLAEAGVNVDDLTTWDALLEAMETIKNNGVTPVFMSGKNLGDVAQFFDWFPPAVYITDPNNFLGQELLDGNFNVDTWTITTQMLKDIQDKGYLNVDALTADRSEAARALAVGDAAFEFFGNYIITDAMQFNPDANLGFFPVPAYYEGAEPFLISGERNAVGIWKDSKHIDEAKILLQYLATPEVMTKLASAHAIPAGLVTATSDTGILSDDFEKYAETVGSPYFDRVYLPSGMWDTLGATGAGVLSGEMTPKEAAERVQSDFEKLYK